MHCPACDGCCTREPARVFCRMCGRQAPILDATPGQMRRQQWLDTVLRPGSIETQPPFNAAEHLGWKRAPSTTGAVRLPGDGRLPLTIPQDEFDDDPEPA